MDKGYVEVWELLQTQSCRWEGDVLVLVDYLVETGTLLGTEEGERGGKMSSMTGREGEGDWEIEGRGTLLDEMVKYCQSWVVDDGFWG